MDDENSDSPQQVGKFLSGETQPNVCSMDFNPELLQIASLSIANSTRVQFGNNYYSGPVTINNSPPQTDTVAHPDAAIENQYVEDIREKCGKLSQLKNDTEKYLKRERSVSKMKKKEKKRSISSQSFDLDP